MKDAHQLDPQNANRLHKLYQVSGIAHRHSVLDDFALPKRNYQFFGNKDGLEHFPTYSPTWRYIPKTRFKISTTSN